MDLSELSRARANVYKFLANFFLEEPCTELLDKFSDKIFVSSLKEVFGDASSLGLLENINKKNIDEVKQDYSNLFIVPNKKYLKPYESVYLDEQNIGSKIISGLVHGKSSIAVKKLYKKVKAEINVKELADHIGLELEFMHFLCSKESSSNRIDALDYLESEKEFLEGHLLKWINKFCANMTNNANTDFYKGVAQVTNMFVLDDIKTVNTLMENM